MHSLHEVVTHMPVRNCVPFLPMKPHTGMILQFDATNTAGILQVAMQDQYQIHFTGPLGRKFN